MKHKVKETIQIQAAERQLRLKRQEAEAVRDVLRSFNNPNNQLEDIFKIAQNTLLAQLGIRKMLFLYKEEDKITPGITFGIRQWEKVLNAPLPDKAGTYSPEDVEVQQLEGSGIRYIIAISHKGEVAAWFLLCEWKTSDSGKAGDLIFLETIGHLLSTAIENRKLIREVVAQETLRKELEVAARIQQQLLPKDFSKLEKVDIAAINLAHHKVGGDYYDVIPLSKHQFFLCIADVSGKGVGAALLMANLQAQLNAWVLQEKSLQKIIESLHKALFRITRGEQFVTLFLALIDLHTQTIRYINAGHNPPVLNHKKGLEELKEGTIPLGMVDLPFIETGSTAFSSGDALLLYTDGVVEQNNVEGELFGEQKVYEKFRKNVNARADSKHVLAGLLEMHKDFAGEMPPDDDITMVVLRFA